MNDLKKIFIEINQLTTNIETNYPELYRTLDENPLTISQSKHPHIDKQVMNDYLESLKQLLKNHIKSHKNN
jgi:hypothetical protein